MNYDSSLFLIDAHSLCYRSFYAIKELSTSQGRPTNAVLGFVNTLRKIQKQYNPKYMAVCFDSPEKTLRAKKYTEYKIQRQSMPEPLIEQIKTIKDVVRGYRIPIFEEGGYEADDIIASLVDQYSQKVDIVVVSEDKDMFQLANDHVRFYSSRKDAILDQKDLESQLGFIPTLIPDFLSLAGDNVDNIPGVDGIGEVTAKKLVNKFGRLENILEHVEEVEPVKIREKLLNQKEVAVLSKELALLEAKMKINTTMEELQIKQPDQQALHALFTELEFKRLADEFSLSDSLPEASEDKIVVDEPKTKSDFEALIRKIKNAEQISFLQERGEGLTRLYVVAGDSHVYSIEAENWDKLSAVFEDVNILKVTYNLKQAYSYLSQQKINILGKKFDVMLAAYLCSSSPNAFDLKHLAWVYFKNSIGEEQRAKEAMALSTLFPILQKEIADKELGPLLDKIEIPLSEVLFKMESHGVKLDVDLLGKLSQECEVKIKGLTTRLYHIAGEEFNLNSPKQLSHILFEKLKLPVVKKTKTGFSTDEEVLTKLSIEHEFPSMILEYRQLAKLKSTYIDSLPKLVNPETGRIHASFNQTGAETGRLSSNDPNLQNIPIRTELGREIRKAFIARDSNHLILSADYSQIELRILAHLAKDENMSRAFANGQDIHTYTASLIFNVDESKIDDKMRDTAKRVNFGIIYGMSAYGLSKDLGISGREAQEFIDLYFLRYPKVKSFMDSTIASCEVNGYVKTMLNRRRYIPEINSKNIGLKQFAQRQAINTPVQGTAADMMKIAMIHIQNEIENKKLKTEMIITVHDELVFDVPKNEREAIVALVRTNMESAIQLDVEVKVSIKIGTNWLEVQDV